MPGKDYELERLRAEMDNAQREIDAAKSRLDCISSRRAGVRSEIEAVKYRIADIKRHIDEEYRAMKYCYSVKDRISGDNHRYNAESYKNSLQREYDIKKSLYEQGNNAEFEAALAALRSAKERKRQASNAFHARLQEVKAQREAERAKWREKSCKKCGKVIRYHIEWSHVPDLCKECQAREKAKWHEKSCRICGKTIRYHEDWNHIPTVCKECRASNTRR